MSGKGQVFTWVIIVDCCEDDILSRQNAQREVHPLPVHPLLLAASKATFHVKLIRRLIHAYLPVACR